jgi:hypothetical protein
MYCRWSFVGVGVGFPIDTGFVALGTREKLKKPNPQPRPRKRNARSFLTSERPEDSNATPPRTISFFWVPTLDTGLLLKGGAVEGAAVDEGPGVAGADVAGVVGLESGRDGPAAFRPGRTYLFEGGLYPGLT